MRVWAPFVFVFSSAPPQALMSMLRANGTLEVLDLRWQSGDAARHPQTAFGVGWSGQGGATYTCVESTLPPPLLRDRGRFDAMAVAEEGLGRADRAWENLMEVYTARRASAVLGDSEASPPRRARRRVYVHRDDAALGRPGWVGRYIRPPSAANGNAPA